MRSVTLREHPRIARLCQVAGLSILAAACGDVPAPTAVALKQGSPLATPWRGLRDAEINRADTYFAVDITSRTEPTGARSSGGNMPAVLASSYTNASYESLWSSRYVEVGYDANGQFRLNVYRNASSDPALQSPPSLVRAAGNTVYVYDQSGVLIGQHPVWSFFDGAGQPGGATDYATPNYDAKCDYDETGELNCDGGDAEFFMMGGAATSTVLLGDVLELVTRFPERSSLPGSRSASAQAGAGAPQAVRLVRRYSRQQMEVTDSATGKRERAEKWLIQSREFVWLRSRGGIVDTARSVTSYRYQAAHAHDARQGERQRNLANTPRPTRASNISETKSSSSATIATAVTCESVQMTKGISGGTVTWIHGWMSKGDAWCGMRSRAAESHYIALDQALSTDWWRGIDTQRDDLVSRLMGGPHVLVAHSQGGLIARSFGQDRPDLVSGVITMGAPHLGAYLASNAKEYIAQWMYDAISGGCIGQHAMCGLFEGVKQQLVSEFLTWGIDQTVPVANDAAYNSPLVNRLTSSYEPFLRASIQISVPPRWAIFRLIGDAATPSGQFSPLEGENWANTADIVYLATWLLSDFALNARWWTDDYGLGWGCHELAYRDNWPPCHDPYYQSSFWTREVWTFISGILQMIALEIMRGMDWVDYTWTHLTTSFENGAATDGFIQYASQVYPAVAGTSVPLRQLAGRRESHAGETRSEDVLAWVRQYLGDMGVPIKR